MHTTNDSGSWELPEDLRMLRDTIRRFMQEEVKPLEDRLPHDAYTPEPADLLALQRKARAIGLWCFETPAEHGGAGLSLLGQCVAGRTRTCPRRPSSPCLPPRLGPKGRDSRRK